MNLFINGLSEQASRDFEFLKPTSTEAKIRAELLHENTRE